MIYNNEILHFAFIAYYTKISINFKETENRYTTWMKCVVFKTPTKFEEVYKDWK